MADRRKAGSDKTSTFALNARLIGGYDVERLNIPGHMPGFLREQGPNFNVEKLNIPGLPPEHLLSPKPDQAVRERIANELRNSDDLIIPGLPPEYLREPDPQATERQRIFDELKSPAGLEGTESINTSWNQAANPDLAQNTPTVAQQLKPGGASFKKTASLTV